MKKGQHITAFYVETLLLILVFVGILLALTQIFGLSRNESVKAKRLTNAVTLAQEAADTFMAAGKNYQGELVNRFSDDMVPDQNGPLAVQVIWTLKGDMMQGAVTVFVDGETDPLYTLPVCKYVGEVSP